MSTVVVGLERGAPRLARGGVEHLQQRPHRPLGVPRVGVGRTADRPDDRLGHQGGGGAERHSCADAVAIGGAEPVREALRQPPLHALRGHGHHLGGEGLRERPGEHLGQGIGEHVGPLRPVHVDARGGHGVTVGAPTDSTAGGPGDHRTRVVGRNDTIVVSRDAADNGRVVGTRSAGERPPRRPGRCTTQDPARSSVRPPTRTPTSTSAQAPVPTAVLPQPPDPSPRCRLRRRRKCGRDAGRFFGLDSRRDSRCRCRH